MDDRLPAHGSDVRSDAARAPVAGGLLTGRTEAPTAAPVAEGAGDVQRAADARTAQIGQGVSFDQARAYARDAAAAAQAQAQAQAATAARPAEDEAAPDARERAAAVAASVPQIRELRPTAPRRGLVIGEFHIGQAVTWQLAAIASVAAYRHSMAAFIPVLVVSIAAIVVTAVRVNGKWLYEWLALLAGYLTRRRRHTVTPTDAPGVLQAVTRGGHLDSVPLDEDRDLSLIGHAGGFTTVLEVSRPLTSGQVSTDILLPSLEELLPTYDSTDPPVSVQVLVSTVPAPGLRASEDAVASSYYQLSKGQVPAQRRTWIALQAMHTADGYRPQDMKTALINATNRVTRKLAKIGLDSSPLRSAELADELFALIHPGETDGATRPGIRESWKHWSSGGELHVTFHIKNWPDLAVERGADLVQGLADVPASSIAVSVSARRDGTANQVEAVVRLTVPDETFLPRALDALEHTAARAGAQLERLDGQHLLGLSASVPVGGFRV